MKLLEPEIYRFWMMFLKLQIFWWMEPEKLLQFLLEISPQRAFWLGRFTEPYKPKTKLPTVRSKVSNSNSGINLSLFSLTDAAPTFSLTQKLKPVLEMDGYSYRQFRWHKNHILWLCRYDRAKHCKGRIKTTYENEIIPGSMNPHSCTPSKQSEYIIIKTKPV